jgi:hypothetical protein
MEGFQEGCGLSLVSEIAIYFSTQVGIILACSSQICLTDRPGQITSLQEDRPDLLVALSLFRRHQNLPNSLKAERLL